jgi:hypothetical protein
MKSMKEGKGSKTTLLPFHPFCVFFLLLVPKGINEARNIRGILFPRHLIE